MAKKKQCKKCNTVMNKGEKTCSNCGAKISTIKIPLIITIILLLIAVIIIVGTGQNNENPNNIEAVKKIDESEIAELDYLNLYDHYKDYKNKYVRIAGCISALDTNILGDTYITFKDGLSGVTGMIYCTVLENEKDKALNCKEGDYVCIVGKCSSKTINTLNINDCYIDAENEVARGFYESMKYKFQLEESEAAAEKEAKERAEKEQEAAERSANEDSFKSNCQTIGYTDIARDSQGLKGQDFTFTGQIIQVSGNTYRMNVTIDEFGYYDDTIVFNFDTGDGDRILEDDIVTIWGTSKGLFTYTSVLGSEITVPEIDAKYVVIN